MKSNQVRLEGTPTLSKLGQVAMDRFIATSEKRRAKRVYGEKCEAFKKDRGERFELADPEFHAFTKAEYASLQDAKAKEYNAVRRFDRACIAFIQGGVGNV